MRNTIPRHPIFIIRRMRQRLQLDKLVQTRLKEQQQSRYAALTRKAQRRDKELRTNQRIMDGVKERIRKARADT